MFRGKGIFSDQPRSRAISFILSAIAASAPVHGDISCRNIPEVQCLCEVADCPKDKKRPPTQRGWQVDLPC